MDNPIELVQLFSSLFDYFVILILIILTMLSLIFKRETVVKKHKITSKILPFNWYKWEIRMEDISSLDYQFNTSLDYQFSIKGRPFVSLQRKDGSKTSSICDVGEFKQAHWFMQEVSSFTGLEYHL